LGLTALVAILLFGLCQKKWSLEDGPIGVVIMGEK